MYKINNRIYSKVYKDKYEINVVYYTFTFWAIALLQLIVQFPWDKFPSQLLVFVDPRWMDTCINTRVCAHTWYLYFTYFA
jgi:hypothetical protein